MSKKAEGICGGGFLSAELKEEFLKSGKAGIGSSLRDMERFLILISKYVENPSGRDVFRMDRGEIIMNIQNSGIYNPVQLLRMIRCMEMYAQFAYSRIQCDGYLKDDVVKLENISLQPSLYRRLIPDAKQLAIILRNMVHEHGFLRNEIPAMVFYWSGVPGKEIRMIKDEDVSDDCKEIRSESGMYTVPDELCEYLSGYRDTQEGATLWDGNIVCYKMDSDYFLKHIKAYPVSSIPTIMKTDELKYSSICTIMDKASEFIEGLCGKQTGAVDIAKSGDLCRLYESGKLADEDFLRSQDVYTRILFAEYKIFRKSNPKLKSRV